MAEFQVQRRTALFTFLAIVLLFFSILSYFEIFSIADLALTSYCRLPQGFECEKMVVAPQIISILVQYSGEDLQQLSVQAPGCTSYEDNSIKRRSQIKIELACETTLGVGKTYKAELLFSSLGENSLQPIEEKGKIKAKVQSGV